MLTSFLELVLRGSDYRREDLSPISLAVLRELLYRLFAIFTPFSLSACMLYAWYFLSWKLALFESIILVFLVVNFIKLYRDNTRLISNLAFCFVIMFMLAMPIALGEYDFLYFCLVFPTLFYLLLDRGRAIGLNVVWLLICGALAFLFLTVIPAICFVVTHIAIWLFIEILFSMMTHNEKELKLLSIKDPLTGVFNRRAMESILEDALMFADRYTSNSSIIMLDIDHFKMINDNYGHKEGDIVLQGITRLIEGRMRRIDKLCRYGGEEFVLLLAGTDYDEALEIADSLCELVRDTILTSKQRVTISCGVAQTQRGDTIETWLDRSDQALYEAKQTGRDRVAGKLLTRGVA